MNRDKRTGLAMVRVTKVVVEPKARSEVLCRAVELEEGGEEPLYPECWEYSIRRRGRIARLSVARSAEKGALSPVVQAHGTMKWCLSGVSRKSLYDVG